jgi:hypothetical protein
MKPRKAADNLTSRSKILRYKWYVLPRIICAPAAISSSGDKDLTEPLVPTGINTGVSTTPCSVRITPDLARDSVDWAINSNENMVVWVVYGPLFVVIKFRYYIF